MNSYEKQMEKKKTTTNDIFDALFSQLIQSIKKKKKNCHQNNQPYSVTETRGKNNKKKKNTQKYSSNKTL